MLKHIISEIATYEQVANNPNVPKTQRDHARLMCVGLCAYLIRFCDIPIMEIIAMIDALDSTETQ